MICGIPIIAGGIMKRFAGCRKEIHKADDTDSAKRNKSAYEEVFFKKGKNNHRFFLGEGKRRGAADVLKTEKCPDGCEVSL